MCAVCAQYRHSASATWSTSSPTRRPLLVPDGTPQHMPFSSATPGPTPSHYSSPDISDFIQDLNANSYRNMPAQSPFNGQTLGPYYPPAGELPEGGEQLPQSPGLSQIPTRTKKRKLRIRISAAALAEGGVPSETPMLV